MLWDQSSGLFRSEAAFGYDLGILREMGLQAGESITGKVFDQGQACLFGTPEAVADAMSNMRSANRKLVARSLASDALPRCAVAAPIAADDQKLGVLVLETLDDTSAFNERDLPFVQTLAELIALAIDRERLKVRADAVREARRAERTRSEVMAALSHELRMPLATIKGYATALLLDEVTWSEAKRKDFLQLIEEACNDMEGMIQDILDSSLIEVDQLGVECRPVRLPDIAVEMAAEAQQRSQVHRAVVEFSADFPVVPADPRWIKQVFRNILDNAIKYSPDGGLIVIKGKVRPEDVVISVADQGIGISPENLIPLFEKYFRVRSAASLHVPGTGLGLPIARILVEAHGGRIWVESKAGEGTTIYFSLPREGVRNDRE
jgi:K+-sensing histidine kinase KdpD